MESQRVDHLEETYLGGQPNLTVQVSGNSNIQNMHINFT